MGNDHDSNLLFRSQYLQAFNIDFFDLNIINNTCEKLFNLMKENEADRLNDILAHLYNKYSKELLPYSFNKNYTNLFTFQLLFSYNHFDIFHKCLIDIINLSAISNENYNILIESINDKELNLSSK